MIDIVDIHAARERIRDHVLKTPLYFSDQLSDVTGAQVWLKLESEQYTGSFKARGALNKILSGEGEGPYYTASTGNHAQGFARALALSGKSGKIFLPKNVSEAKLNALRKFPVDLEFYGNGPLETELHTKEIAHKEGAIWVSPYNDEDVICGQGTLALEILEDLPDPDAVFACIGGGGMISGVGTVVKSMSDAQLVGALPERSPEMYLSVKENRFIEMAPQETLSDGSAGGFEEGAMTYELCKQLVDRYELVSEEEIADAIRLIAKSHHKMIEGAAGVAVAAFLKQRADWQGKKVVIVICGANISLETYSQIIA